MNDLISRQAAIDALRQQFKKSPTTAIRAMNTIEELPSAQPEQRWIPVSDRLPKCEQEVLICTKRCERYIITPAMYEDGTMLEVHSKWRWEDIDYAGWDEEEDCGIIPEGWWENRHFNDDGVYNNVIDVNVLAWKPLPEPYKGEEE